MRFPWNPEAFSLIWKYQRNKCDKYFSAHRRLQPIQLSFRLFLSSTRLFLTLFRLFVDISLFCDIFPAIFDVFSAIFDLFRIFWLPRFEFRLDKALPKLGFILDKSWPRVGVRFARSGTRFEFRLAKCWPRLGFRRANLGQDTHSTEMKNMVVALNQYWY